MNKNAIPEMQEWCRRIGYEVWVLSWCSSYLIELDADFILPTSHENSID